MSEQAEKFLAQWEIEHIKMVARSDREDQAQRLALRCREDAAKVGISGQDLEAAAEGNLIENILQALDDAEFRQMYRDQVAEQEED
jgi:C4-dicarboxylate-specific signal transduction histidine kinase